jgi:hypothetical protein
MNHIKDLRAEKKAGTVEPEDLIPFYPWLLSGPDDH